MRKIFILQLSLFVFIKTNAQQTIHTTLSLSSNGVNSTEILMYKQDNSSYYDIYANHGGFGIFNTTTNAYPFSINATDFVGIGTNNPGCKLDVQGGTANVNLDNISSLGGQLTISNGYGNQNGSVRLNLNNGGAVSWIKGIVTGPNTNTGSAIIFGVPSETTDGVERMRITSSGDVGIGTADSKGYKLAVNGKIRAQEIKVENAYWPDYVFAKNYQLPSLQETEKHIKEKGHLPGIPSAADVKANGIDLGEMNAKLLQKIEELTLYLIEIKKENQDMRTRLSTLESK